MPRWVASKAGFDMAVATDKLIIIDFTASWCGPCKMIGPVFDELSKTAGNLDFIKIDVDVNEETSAACGIKSMPTFQVWRHGKKLDEFSGADKTALRNLVERYDSPASLDCVKPGDTVELQGLQSKPELNGSEADVLPYEQWPENGRICVQLRSDLQQVLSLKASNLLVRTVDISIARRSVPADVVIPKPGQHVVINGLKSKPEFNGKRGIVQPQTQSSNTSRVVVMLSTTASVSAKVDNLAVVSRKKDDLT